MIKKKLAESHRAAVKKIEGGEDIGETTSIYYGEEKKEGGLSPVNSYGPLSKGEEKGGVCRVTTEPDKRDQLRKRSRAKDRDSCTMNKACPRKRGRGPRCFSGAPHQKTKRREGVKKKNGEYPVEIPMSMAGRNGKDERWRWGLRGHALKSDSREGGRKIKRVNAKVERRGELVYLKNNHAKN